MSPADPAPTEVRSFSPSRYTSAEFMRLEWERLWPRVWMFVGPATDVAEPGQWITHKVGHESIVITRDAAGLHAFYNVCQHRGRPLCLSPRGCSPTLRCTFHNWTYGLDGELRAMVDADQFPQPRSELALEPVSVAEHNGFLWINLSRDPEPIESYLGPVSESMRAYRPGPQYALVDDVEIEVRSNWKAGVDIFVESLHIHAQHPDLLSMLDDTRARTTPLGPRHWHLTTPLATPSGRLARVEGLPGMLPDQLSRAGIDPKTFDGTAYDVRDRIARKLRETGPALGFDDSALTDAQLTDNHLLYIFPNVEVIFYAREIMVFRHRPHATDPLRSYMDFQLYKRQPSTAKQRPPRPEVRRLTAQHHLDQLPGDVVQQDAALLDMLSEGLVSRGLRRINLGRAENIVSHFHALVDRYLDTPPDAKPPFA